MNSNKRLFFFIFLRQLGNTGPVELVSFLVKLFQSVDGESSFKDSVGSHEVLEAKIILFLHSVQEDLLLVHKVLPESMHRYL